MSRRAAWVLALLVLGWACAALRLIVEVRRAHDEHRHWDLRELFDTQQVFYRGVYPHTRIQTPPADLPAIDSVYPPYSFVLAVPWIPPGLAWQAVRVWFTVCQVAAIAALLGFAWRQGRTLGPALGWLLLGAGGAISGIWADFLYGNFAALACLPLLLVWSGLDAARPWRAGVGWLGAMLKPQVGWLFAVLFLTRRRWLALAVGGAGLAAATGLAWAWTGVAPWRALAEVYATEWVPYATDGYSLVTVAATFGVGAGIAQPLFALAGVASVLLVVRRDPVGRDRLALLALTAMLARLCVYHHPDDDVLMLFPVVYLGVRAWMRDRTADWLWFTLLAVSTWFPWRITGYGHVRDGVILFWLVVAGRIFADCYTRPPAAAMVAHAIGESSGARS